MEYLATISKDSHWPDYARLDCAAGHHPLQTPGNQWRLKQDKHGRAAGRPPFNSAQHAALKHLARAIAPKDAAELERAVGAVYATLSSNAPGRGATAVAASRADSEAGQLLAKVRTATYDFQIACRLIVELARDATGIADQGPRAGLQAVWLLDLLVRLPRHGSSGPMPSDLKGQISDLYRQADLVSEFNAPHFAHQLQRFSAWAERVSRLKDQQHHQERIRRNTHGVGPVPEETGGPSMHFRTALFLTLALCAPAHAGLSPMDREDLADIQRWAAAGRVKEARALLATCLTRAPGGAIGARYDRVEPFLALARTMGVPDETPAIVQVMREDGVALAQQARTAREADRPEVLRAAVRCLKRVPTLTGEELFERGWAQFEVGEPAAARADLAAAVALAPDHVDARGALARAQWRLGQRRAALETVLAGMKRTPSRADAALLASMLRAAKHGGQAKRAGELAGTWANGLADAAHASPLRTLVAEIQLEQGELDAAVDTFAQVVAEDRPWLLGGLVRTARARARGGDVAGVLAAIRRLPLERDRMPAPLLKLAGDIALTRREPAVAVRHYAAALTGGELEARELAARARARLGAGSITELLAGKPAAYDSAGTDPGTFADPLAAGGAFFQLDAQALEANLAVPAEVGAAWREPAARRAAYALAVMKNPRLDPKHALNLAVEQSTPVTARRKMVHAYLSGDIATARSELDALSLVSWQVIRPGVVGALRVAPPGSGAANVEPLTQTTAPAALDSVGQALAALNDPAAAEQVRLAKLMEVASQRAPDSETLEDPVAIDLDGNGRIDLTVARSAEGAAWFDLEGRGRPRDVQWLVAGRDGWLCEDVDGDGQISSGLELFGTAGGYTDGFEKLARRDRDNDGVLTATELAGLSVWCERVEPGRVNEGELIPVEEAGVTSISVPRVGLRTTAVVSGVQRLCAEVWPEAANPQVAQGGLIPDLEGI